MPLSLPLSVPPPVITVKGPVPYDQLGITDVHNHVWIEAVPGLVKGNPVLDKYELILKELLEYRQQGGGTILDCQPGGCGRNGSKLLELSQTSRVNILACTGFHRKKYYPQSYWLWDVSAQNISEYLCSELEQGLTETLDTPLSVRAGFIKIALESSWTECPQAALEGAALAAYKTKALLEIHTEKGLLAEKACVYFTDQGVLPNQLVICHMDKKPDFSLHRALASFGVLLEYDTFYRPKYNPVTNLWPLIEQMVGVGHADRIALATDMAESALYHQIGGGPGLVSLPGEIRDTLKQKGFPDDAIVQMVGGNIARRLAGIH